MNHSTKPRQRQRRERRGTALILVLVAMVVLAVLSSASMMSAFQEARSSRASQIQQRALTVAEFGLNQQLANWPATRQAMAVGAIDEVRVPVALGDEALVRVQRLNPLLFNVVSVGRAGIGNGLMEAQRQVSQLVRFSTPSIRPTGTFTTFGNVTISGSMSLTGRNTTPPGWTGCPAAPDAFAITHNPARVPNVNKPATQAVGGLSASPAAADPNTYTVFGTETWASLVAKANVRVTGGSASPSPSGSSTTCNTTSSSNWGEPARSAGHTAGCVNYFPIIYSSGNLVINGGRGQGILIVDGSLRMINHDFVGLVLVRDHMLNGGGTSSVRGAVMIRSANNQTTSMNANHSFAYSFCGVDRALSALATPARPNERAWGNVY